MSITAHHLRVSAAGRLEQEDDLGAVLGVLQVMAGTTSTHWAHAPWFGLYESFVAASRQQTKDHEALKDAINTAFTQLGAERFHVASVSSRDRAGPGPRQFELVIEDRDGNTHFGAVRLP